MPRKGSLIAAAAVLAFGGGLSQAQELRIGFLNTTTGGGALIGRHLENGWKLGLEHEGWTKDGDKLAGVPTRVFYADDQLKPDQGVQEVEKFLKQHRTQVVAGIIWSNVLMAVSKPIFEAKAMMLVSNAGASPMAGALCHPNYVTTSFVNDQNAEATGELVTRDRIENVLALAPNFQAGKDMVEGFKRTYKGRIVDTIYFKNGETDFQAELSKVRAVKPKAVFIFAAGAMGVSFMKQWAASGLAGEVKLYTLYAVDEVTLPGIGDAAIGTVETGHYNPDANNPANEKFRKDYTAKYGHKPSYFAMQAYDGPRVLAMGLRATGGKLDDMQAVARAIRKSTYDSPRGRIAWNVNGFPIQTYWKLEIVKGADGKPTVAGREEVFTRKDDFWEKCPPERRT